MAVIKKTIVLSKGTTKGYITVVKIGSQAAAKLHLNQLPKTPQWLLVKIGALEPIAFEVGVAHEEYALPHEFTSGDSIGVAVVNRQGEIYAFGGNRYGLDIKSFVASLQEKLIDISDVIEVGESDIQEEISDNGYQKPALEEPELVVNDVIDEEPDVKKVPEDDIAKQVELAPAEVVNEVAPPIENEEVVVEEEVPIAKKKRKQTKPRTAKKESVAAPMAEGVAAEPAKVKRGSRTAAIADEDNFNEMFSETEIANFYSTVQSRLEDIFVINPRETELASLVPDSKWVRVYYDKNDYYVVGVLSDEGNVSHIAYGVKGVASVLPPPEAQELCDFLPTDKEGNGYWLMFQRSDSGAVIKNADL